MKKLTLAAMIAATLVACSKSPQAERADSEAQIQAILAQMTLEEKIALLHANSKFTNAGVPRLGVPELVLSDGPHGVRYEIERHSWNPVGGDDDYSTYLAPLTTVAATWDLEMAKLHGQVLGAEARNRGKDIILGPGINMARLPLYGRNFEYMGEDPYLVSKMVVPVVKGIQENDVAANAKHYALNTQELNRIGVNAQPDERTLREIYLPGFEAAVKEGGVYSIMGAYNEYMGTNANQAPHLNNTILKGEWGFDGVLLTDWNVDINTYEAAHGGLDLEMGTDVADYQDFNFAKPLLEMVKAGKVDEALIDDKALRILRLTKRVGAMDEGRSSGERNTKKHQNIAYTIASKGIVLLKNDGNQLPLDNDITNILVLGPNADKVHGLGGGSSEVKTPYEVTPLQGLKNRLGDKVNITYLRAKSDNIEPIAADYISSRHWTGTPAWNVKYFKDNNFTDLAFESWMVNSDYKYNADEGYQSLSMTATIKPQKSGVHQFKLANTGTISIKLDGKVMAITDNAFSSDLEVGKEYPIELKFVGQSDFTLAMEAPGNPFVAKEEYLAAAKAADKVIYIGGLSHADDREAIDRSHMRLPGNQNEVISNLAKVTDKLTVALVAGSAVEMPWLEQVNSLLWLGYGGMEGGNAFADVLTAKVNPSGKMPYVLPKSLADTAPMMLDDYNAQDSFYKEGVLIGHRWFEAKNLPMLFPFGHGLSYSSFDYSDLKLSKSSVNAVEGLTVTVNITNTSQRDGEEIVQLYLSDLESSVVQPVKALKGFTKVALKAGETKQVTLQLTKRDFAFWDVNSNDWKVEPGAFTVSVGASQMDIKLSQQVNVVQ
ncbi:glycoside hydrolase family 3 C-terminal domain-containing protein [Paraferrimonas sp. SM1919]|uniref:beta-glucosidase n=1 Tax=Paraferrimonas sp. SM1919 TaxID=2662263 RepID=UPI001F08FEB2|nr:glycoside hydrolase family 3 C-terminal domain-containing protein [Paraferrimonas sp. SM1919]